MWPNVDASSDLGYSGYKVLKGVDVVIYAEFAPCCGVFRLTQGTCNVAGLLDPCTTGGTPVRLMRQMGFGDFEGKDVPSGSFTVEHF